jgi:hypothetical protein
VKPVWRSKEINHGSQGKQTLVGPLRELPCADWLNWQGPGVVKTLSERHARPGLSRKQPSRAPAFIAGLGDRRREGKKTREPSRMLKVVSVVKCALARSLGCVCKFGSISSFLIGDVPGGLFMRRSGGENNNAPRREKKPAKKHVCIIIHSITQRP